MDRIVREPRSRCFARVTPALNTSQQGATSPHAHPQTAVPSDLTFFFSSWRGAVVSRLNGAGGLISASETPLAV